jgi:hypothetical protein
MDTPTQKPKLADRLAADTADAKSFGVLFRRLVHEVEQLEARVDALEAKLRDSGSATS